MEGVAGRERGGGGDEGGKGRKERTSLNTS